MIRSRYPASDATMSMTCLRMVGLLRHRPTHHPIPDCRPLTLGIDHLADVARGWLVAGVLAAEPCAVCNAGTDPG